MIRGLVRVLWISLFLVSGNSFGGDYRNCGLLSQNKEEFFSRPWLHISAAATTTDKWKIEVQATPEIDRLLLGAPYSCDEVALFYPSERDSKGLPVNLYRIRITDLGNGTVVELQSNAIELRLKGKVHWIEFRRVVRTTPHGPERSPYLDVTPDATERATDGDLSYFRVHLLVTEKSTSLAFGPVVPGGVYGQWPVSSIHYFSLRPRE